MVSQSSYNVRPVLERIHGMNGHTEESPSGSDDFSDATANTKRMSSLILALDNQENMIHNYSHATGAR